MPHEKEVRFVGVDFDGVRNTLGVNDYVCLFPARLMRRTVFAVSGVKETSAYVRVRDEGDRITMTYKEVVSTDNVGGVIEHEVVVSDFEAATAILTLGGLSVKAYQETRREAWLHEATNVAVTLDEWPGLPPFIEIEAPSIDILAEAVEILGFASHEPFYGAVDGLYERFLGISRERINRWPEITFDKPPAPQ